MESGTDEKRAKGRAPGDFGSRAFEFSVYEKKKDFAGCKFSDPRGRDGQHRRNQWGGKKYACKSNLWVCDRR